MKRKNIPLQRLNMKHITFAQKIEAKYRSKVDPYLGRLTLIFRKDIVSEQALFPQMVQHAHYSIFIKKFYLRDASPFFIIPQRDHLSIFRSKKVVQPLQQLVKDENKRLSMFQEETSRQGTLFPRMIERSQREAFVSLARHRFAFYTKSFDSSHKKERIDSKMITSRVHSLFHRVDERLMFAFLSTSELAIDLKNEFLRSSRIFEEQFVHQLLAQQLFKQIDKRERRSLQELVERTGAAVTLQIDERERQRLLTNSETEKNIRLVEEEQRLLAVTLQIDKRERQGLLTNSETEKSIRLAEEKQQLSAVTRFKRRFAFNHRFNSVFEDDKRLVKEKLSESRFMKRTLLKGTISDLVLAFRKDRIGDNVKKTLTSLEKARLKTEHIENVTSASQLSSQLLRESNLLHVVKTKRLLEQNIQKALLSTLSSLTRLIHSYVETVLQKKERSELAEVRFATERFEHVAHLLPSRRSSIRHLNLLRLLEAKQLQVGKILDTSLHSVVRSDFERNEVLSKRRHIHHESSAIRSRSQLFHDLSLFRLLAIEQPIERKIREAIFRSISFSTRATRSLLLFQFREERFSKLAAVDVEKSRRTREGETSHSSPRLLRHGRQSNVLEIERVLRRKLRNIDLRSLLYDVSLHTKLVERENAQSETRNVQRVIRAERTSELLLHFVVEKLFKQDVPKRPATNDGTTFRKEQVHAIAQQVFLKKAVPVHFREQHVTWLLTHGHHLQQKQRDVSWKPQVLESLLSHNEATSHYASTRKHFFTHSKFLTFHNVAEINSFNRFKSKLSQMLRSIDFKKRVYENKHISLSLDKRETVKSKSENETRHGGERSLLLHSALILMNRLNERVISSILQEQNEIFKRFKREAALKDEHVIVTDVETTSRQKWNEKLQTNELKRTFVKRKSEHEHFTKSEKLPFGNNDRYRLLDKKDVTKEQLLSIVIKHEQLLQRKRSKIRRQSEVVRRSFEEEKQLGATLTTKALRSSFMYHVSHFVGSLHHLVSRTRLKADEQTSLQKQRKATVALVTNKNAEHNLRNSVALRSNVSFDNQSVLTEKSSFQSRPLNERFLIRLNEVISEKHFDMKKLKSLNRSIQAKAQQALFLTNESLTTHLEKNVANAAKGVTTKEQLVNHLAIYHGEQARGNRLQYRKQADISSHRSSKQLTEMNHYQPVKEKSEAENIKKLVEKILADEKQKLATVEKEVPPQIEININEVVEEIYAKLNRKLHFEQQRRGF